VCAACSPCNQPPPLPHQGKRHGSGTHRFANGIDEYEGEWSRDFMHGRGCIMRANGSSFDGVFALDLPHGKGTMMMKVRGGGGAGVGGSRLW